MRTLGANGLKTPSFPSICLASHLGFYINVRNANPAIKNQNVGPGGAMVSDGLKLNLICLHLKINSEMEKETGWKRLSPELSHRSHFGPSLGERN